jgi:hypothetical protein
MNMDAQEQRGYDEVVERTGSHRTASYVIRIARLLMGEGPNREVRGTPQWNEALDELKKEAGEEAWKIAIDSYKVAVVLHACDMSSDET